MKKLIALLALPVVMVTFFACNNQPAETKKEVIASPPVIIKEKDPVVIVKDPPEKETEVTLDKNGVKVKTKKVNVVIDPKKN